MSLFSLIVPGFKFLLGSPLDRILTSIDKKIDNETEREKIKADVKKRFIEADVQLAVTRKQAFGAWTKYYVTAFLLGPCIWWNGVFLDSVFFHKGFVDALPEAFYPWMSLVISSIFFTSGVKAWTNRNRRD